MPIRFYADSADLDAVLPLVRDGIVYGVTTNPTILARDGWRLDTLERLVGELTDAGAQEIFLQTWGGSYAEMRSNLDRLMAFDGPTVAKIPATRDGYHLAAEVAKNGDPLLLTAVYSLAQAVAAAAIGARYIAPYLGRLNDAGLDGDRLVPAMQAAIGDSGTDVLVASVRTPGAAAAMAANGVQLITAAPAVIEATMVHDITADAVAGFERDWNGGQP